MVVKALGGRWASTRRGEGCCLVPGTMKRCNLFLQVVVTVSVPACTTLSIVSSSSCIGAQIVSGGCVVTSARVVVVVGGEILLNTE